MRDTQEQKIAGAAKGMHEAAARHEAETTLDLAALEQSGESTEGSAPAPDGTRQVTLSDGRVAKVRPAFGYHLERAAAAARDASNIMSLYMALVGEVTVVGERRIVYEELREMPIEDVLVLVGAVGGKVPGPSLLSETRS